MKIVNIIPHTMSDDSHQDSGASIAVNPRNTNEIVISTYTPDPNGGPNSPVFVSIDGGDTWSLRNIVPGHGSSGFSAITLKFGTTTDELYAAVLPEIAPGGMNIFRTQNPDSGAIMTNIDTPQGFIEQPFVAAVTVSSGPDKGKDRLYVGQNNLQGQEFFGSGQSSGIRQTMDALAAAPVFTNVSLDKRVKVPGSLQDLTPPRNGPQVRPSVHQDGTVYALFYSWQHWEDFGDGNGNVAADVVIVRDDNWGQSINPYTALLDSGDGQAGQRIATSVPLICFGSLGQERIAGELAIAVDPTNSSIVYVAWAELIDDGGGGEIDLYLIHLRKSTNRGQSWSFDLLNIPNGKNPALAINVHGQVGFLYQQLTGQQNSQRWETHLAFSGDSINWSDSVLATVPADTPIRQFFPYIGDYADMMAVGDTFYGVFCANNTPPEAALPDAISPDFPLGVTYQRNSASGFLLNQFGSTPIATSIDPYFFKTSFIPPKVKLPTPKYIAEVIFILFGIIQDGGGAYRDPSGHIHIIGPGDPGPVWSYLVNLAEYRLATDIDDESGLQLQKQALANIIDLANSNIADINARLAR
jgi:hypothetical protein